MIKSSDELAPAVERSEPAAAPFAGPPGQSFLRRARRRAITIPAFLLAWVAAVALAPVMFPACFVIDVVRYRHFAFVRAYAFLLLYLSCEVVGIAMLAWLLLRYSRKPATFIARNFALQCWWSRVMFYGGLRIYSMKVEADGLENVAQGPMVAFVRHVSPFDNLVPSVFVADLYGVRLRWVMNHSLLRDPCIDILGNRLPNAFVNGLVRDIRSVRSLASGLGPQDGVLIYPEGGLFSPKNRQRLLDKLRAARDPGYEQAAAFRNVLPPRLGGALALLEANTDADVVFIVHTGLEDAQYRKLFGGAFVGARLRIHAWRVAAADVPTDRKARGAWLFEQWTKADSWIEANRAPALPR
ncbi:MAG TPA: 1-acyl-sn-glycerol-3-phosphate acyltransferase [Tepidiformaceae bacterium]|nr:1-acyl-sn-glycerol-3-phosphate acyltransferase [Tepidiformaceae bacterium]